MKYKKPPKFHHYWPGIASMPPLPHPRRAFEAPETSEVLRWIAAFFSCSLKTANAAFDSARHAGYAIPTSDGGFKGSAIAGYRKYIKAEPPTH